MAVLLSPVGGVAGQFFDNNGNPLSGGKMYSYVAGTTTPQVTYTSAAGSTAHSNPIVLDSGGRVPGGEIWLTDGLQYKFVLKTSTDVLIGTYDNIVGINSNFVNFLTETEVQTATASQTVFTLTTMQYQPGTNNLSVFVDGVNQIDGATYSYVETSSTVVTFTSGLHVGALVKFTTAQTLSTGVTASNLVTYQPAGTGAVATTVQTKLRESVSVKDFGAVGDGVTDDTAAIQAAIASISLVTYGGGEVFFSKGNYLTTSTIYIPQSITLKGVGRRGLVSNTNVIGSCIIGKHTGAAIVSMKGSAFCGLDNICLWGDQTISPKTGLCLGRTTGAASSGRHYLANFLVGGWFTAAGIYSIASEENTLVSPHILIIGGGAKYAFYTSKTDDLSVDSLTSGSNWGSGSIVSPSFLHQGNTADSAAIYINAALGSSGWNFKGGFTGMTSGANSAHVWINVAEVTSDAKDYIFQDLGSESVINATPPVQHYRVTSSIGPCTLSGLVIKNCTPGQNAGGTSYYVKSDDSIILSGCEISEVVSDHPTKIWRLEDSTVSIPGQDLQIGSAAIRCILNARNTVSAGVGGAIVNTLSLSPVYGPVVWTGISTVNDMTISNLTVFTGSAQVNLRVEIDATTLPNTFKWSLDNGSTYVATNVPITSSPQLLTQGIYIKFALTTTHAIGDYWNCKFDPVLLPTQSH